MKKNSQVGIQNDINLHKLKKKVINASSNQNHKQTKPNSQDAP
jgi:hypothetical protein